MKRLTSAGPNERERLKLERLPSSSATRYRIRLATRVLEEFGWREKCLAAEDVDPLCIEGLIYAIAPCFQIGHHWRGVGDPYRSPRSVCT